MVFKMIDTHCHVDFEPFDEDREETIKRAKDKLTAIINSGTSLEGNKRALDLSKEYSDFIYPTFGFHHINSANISDEDLDKTISYIEDHINDILAIGEVGMDYFYVKDKAERAKQGEIFTKFIELANENQIPLLIHARDCEKKAYNVVKEYDNIPSVVFHCYSGSLKTAKKLIDEGYYTSFSTMICYSNHHQELAKEIPIENILTETDSPYLAPKRGDRNEPANVSFVVENLAEIKEESIDFINKCTEKTAKTVFGIK
ncbi:Tat-linked quality control protein TatD [Candidatus Methanobinarius endosymbioticus]|uniref:Tat-linked quality control protein TatD n=1 Tax=Candidatus Methanobinarius endosymbioticus TaxID=2006182 RepID=A0A366MEW1_9EURY|nr:Tat-linked quality control protein TatD [Candidatus Methanobinarius endosymbioticus]